MKTQHSAIVAILAFLVCSTLVRGEGNAVPDGFYLSDETGKSSLFIKIKDRQDVEHRFAVKHLTNFIVKSITVISLKPSEQAFQVQMNIQCPDRDWPKQSIAVVVDNKPYLELSKSGALRGENGIVFSASISLKVPSETEAHQIRDRLSKSFGLDGKAAVPRGAPSNPKR